jgi:hypothetical protein
MQSWTHSSFHHLDGTITVSLQLALPEDIYISYFKVLCQNMKALRFSPLVDVMLMLWSTLSHPQQAKLYSNPQDIMVSGISKILFES